MKANLALVIKMQSDQLLAQKIESKMEQGIKDTYEESHQKITEKKQRDQLIADLKSNHQAQTQQMSNQAYRRKSTQM